MFHGDYYLLRSELVEQRNVARLDIGGDNRDRIAIGLRRVVSGKYKMASSRPNRRTEQHFQSDRTLVKTHHSRSQVLPRTVQETASYTDRPYIQVCQGVWKRSDKKTPLRVLQLMLTEIKFRLYSMMKQYQHSLGSIESCKRINNLLEEHVKI